MTKVFYFNQFRECTYILWDDAKECVIIDPGCCTDREKQRLADFVDSNGLQPVKVLLTHGHFDHIFGLEWVVKRWNIPAYIHPGDADLYVLNNSLCSSFGVCAPMPDIELNNLDEGSFMATRGILLDVMPTPGHTEGSVCLYNRKEHILFSGDTVFKGTIGRCDHPGGDESLLIDSARRCLALLPRDTRILPGHGIETTVGEELDNNPYIWIR